MPGRGRSAGRSCTAPHPPPPRPCRPTSWHCPWWRSCREPGYPGASPALPGGSASIAAVAVAVAVAVAAAVAAAIAAAVVTAAVAVVAVVVAVAVAVVVAAAVAVAKQIVAQSLTCRHTTIHFEENKNPAAQLFAAGK